MGNSKRVNVSIPHRLHEKAKALEINVSEATRRGLKIEIEDRQLLERIHKGELRVETTA